MVLQDEGSLFAGKIHALLCRKYVKGRDWYDFLWYTSRGVEINYPFLTSALVQTGPWQGQNIQVDRDWCVRELREKIKHLNWKTVAQDVAPFVPTAERPSLDLWSIDLFLNRLEKIP